MCLFCLGIVEQLWINEPGTNLNYKFNHCKEDHIYVFDELNLSVTSHTDASAGCNTIKLHKKRPLT